MKTLYAYATWAGKGGYTGTEAGWIHLSKGMPSSLKSINSGNEYITYTSLDIYECEYDESHLLPGEKFPFYPPRTRKFIKSLSTR